MDIQTPPFLELHNAVVQRAGAPILTVDSFRLEEGEHLALLGPNGSGKSTFVKLITREVLPLHRDPCGREAELGRRLVDDAGSDFRTSAYGGRGGGRVVRNAGRPGAGRRPALA